MKSKRLGWAMMVMAATALAGCDTALTGDATLQELLTASGLGNVKVSDVLDAIQQFTSNSGMLPFGGNLTQEQQDQLAALQDQLDSGQITADEFQKQAQDIIGDAADFGTPFGGGPASFFGAAPFAGNPVGFGFPGFPGGPAGAGGPGAPADPLNLTDEQQAQAEAIFDAMRQDVLKLQDDSRAQIDSILTEDQRNQLNDSASAFHGGFRFFGPPIGAGPLSDSLGLTDEQRTQIQSILDGLHTSTESLREQAHNDFRAILTAEQQAAFDEFAADHPHPRAG